MEKLPILAIAVTISISGIIINLLKNSHSVKIKKEDDRSTLFWFRMLVPFALVTSLCFYFSTIGYISVPRWIVVLGYVIIVLGLLIRWFSIASLGDAFTVKISIVENHSLKTDGIYKHVRHPSYTGLLLYYVGLGVIMENWISLSFLICFPLVAVLNRIYKEEILLLASFSEQYSAYQKRSWRLFPYVY